MIRAPYNFVPLNKDIFYPSWSTDVNHDIPFEDGESGIIDITVTAKSPIFIRNHSHTSEVSQEFCHYINEDGGKEFYIPGSSMKGMIRSVLEILSFSKIRLDEEKLKQALSIRDMTNQSELVGTAQGCGLLFFNEDNSAYIIDYGKPRTIESKEIQKKYKGFNVREEDIFKKYKLIPPHSKITVSPYMKPLTNKQGKIIDKKKDAKYVEDGKEGILIINNYIGKKHHEFILLPSDIKEKKRELSTKTIKKFKNVYFTDGDTPTHKLGAFWKTHGKKQGIPVFYIEKDSQITDIGLTQLFKLSYNKTLLDAAKQNSVDDKLDLAETIFGTVRDQHLLKGRVQFSHLKSTITKFEQTKSEILGSPNPSYYPNYIKQTNIKGNKVIKYTTLMDDDAQISGFKRYPLHQTTVTGSSSDKENVKTHFKPLDLGTVFEGKLRFHNLKKAEIGALLSAITFHGNERTHLHNIGMAKALGYGKISIELTTNSSLNFSTKEYLKEFEKEISLKIANWRQSVQLKELLAMSSTNYKKNSQLEYQLLENPKPLYRFKHPEKNDFTGAKKAKEYLLLHSGDTFKKDEKKSSKNLQNPNKSKDISNTQMNKAIATYLNKKYNIRYHKNQIKEFFSNEGFQTTPLEQQTTYTKHRDDNNFIGLLRLIEKFIHNQLDISLKEKLYLKLIKIHI